MLSELLQKTSSKSEELKKFTIGDESYVAPPIEARDDYGKPDYWEGRYAEEDTTFEWLLTWGAIEPMVMPRLDKSFELLHVGCGNSTIGVNMQQSGFAGKIVNTDISKVVIDQMASKFPEQVWEVDDVTKMKYADAQFGCILDKGTMDALMCMRDAQQKADCAKSMVQEYYRVVQPGGSIFIFSFGQPETRLPVLQAQDFAWDISVETITIEGRPSLYLYYITKEKDSGNGA